MFGFTVLKATILRTLAAGVALVAVCAVASSNPALASSTEPAISADQALSDLQAGNSRFVSGTSQYPDADSARRHDTFENGQHPFVTVIACSDSRVPVEFIFDQGIGDMFVVRVAGNVCDTDEIGSIEYGVDHLRTPLMVVLGHRDCGAVTAVVTNALLTGSIPDLVDNIEPAVRAARGEHPELSDSELVPFAVEANVWQGIEDLLTNSPATAALVKSGECLVVGAVYDIETGRVDWLGEHPELNRLIDAAAASPGSQP